MFRGEKFILDISDDEDDQTQQSQRAAAAPGPSPFPFVADVLERKPSAPKPPSAPTPRTSTGFPEHKKRPVQSRFKQRKQQAEAATTVLSDGTTVSSGVKQQTTPSTEDTAPKTWQEQEKTQIDQQNRDVLAGMSQAEIEEARAELLGSLDPDLLQKLLRRANIDSGSNEAESLREPIEGGILQREKPSQKKSVAFADGDSPASSNPPNPTVKDEDEEEATIEVDYEPDFPSTDEHGNPTPATSTEEPQDSHSTIHFPTPTQPPALDPNSTTFLTDLHEKYFPSLPSDPSKLEWMQSSNDNAYSPSASSINPNEIRFSFTGELLAPKTAASIPVSAGLHHHGAAPDAAGYTIPELAHLSRSTYSAQRCVAFQTLGRILFRLGKGEFGDSGEEGGNLPDAENTMGELARGLWREVEKEHVISQLVAESEGNGVDGGRHVSAKAYATEAVWLWRKGGGRRWKAD
ncbi:hypothetical protein Q7P36_005982 [Cladosporium allicinum]